MITYKIDIMEELKKIGINSSTAKKTGLFAQGTLQKFKSGDTAISVEVLNRLCAVLEMQPRDILKFTEDDSDREFLKILK
nr:MAG TPA: Cro/C1-type HTH DNA-binding domain protein [Bacteriophage sp.]